MKVGTFALVISIGAISLVHAHEGATGVVQERMEKMERFEELLDRVFAMVNGELSYDPAAVRRAAEEIRDGAGVHLTAQFPDGSGGGTSDAKNTVWRDFGTFEHLAAMLQNWSGDLADQSGERPHGTLPKRWEDAKMGPGMMQEGGMMGRGGPAFAAWHVAATCNACHAEFRKGE